MITAEDFVTTWQTSTSVSEVAARLQATKKAVCRRSWKLRRRGVPLKWFREKWFREGSSRRLDVAALAKLARELVQDGAME